MTIPNRQPDVDDHADAASKNTTSSTTSVEALTTRLADLERFAAVVTHDLREPLASILGLTELLEVAELDDATRQQCIDGLISISKKLNQTVGALYASVDSGREVHERADLVSFAEVVSDVSIVLGIRPRILSISTDFSAANQMVAPKAYIHSIFQNLISNCIKYRREGERPTLRIESSRTPTSITLTFRDNCLGIDLAKHDNDLFTKGHRFHTDHQSTASSQLGTGHGLYIIKQQVEALGGSIHVKSVVNAGTEFVLEFAQ